MKSIWSMAEGTFVPDKNGILVWNPKPGQDETAQWDGPVMDGFAHGVGTLGWYWKGILVSDYTGEMDNGKCHGKGTYRFWDGDYYRGEWRENLRHGYGRHRFRDGRIYEGRWENDERLDTFPG